MLHKNGITIDPVKCIVSHAGRTVRFFRGKTRERSVLFDVACRLIIGEPATNEELFDTVYGADPDGGPLYGIKLMDVHVHHLTAKIAPLGLKIHKAHCHRDRGWVEKWIAP